MIYPCNASDGATTDSKIVTLNYTFQGESGRIFLEVYPAIDQYLGRKVPVFNNSYSEYYSAYLTDDIQKRYLGNLEASIKILTGNKDDQARIAISLVQQIPYDSEKAEKIDSGMDNSLLFPYHTLISEKGVCSDKSILLAFILKELGYGVALLKFTPENHMVVGIKASKEFSYKKTGYAFIETTSPTIPTYFNGSYGGEKQQLYSDPEIFILSDGIEFQGVSSEYTDAKSWDELQQFGPVLEKDQFEKYQFLIKKYGLKTKNSESNVQPLSHNDEAHLSFEKGVSFANKGNYEQALIYYDEAIASNPRMIAAYLNKGVVLSSLLRYKEANEVFDKVITIQPNSNAAWVNKGNALWQLNDYNGAEESYKKALLLNPDQHKIWHNLGNLYLNMHRDKESRQCFEKENFYKNITLQLPDEPRIILPEKTPFPANIYLPVVFFFWEHAVLIIIFSGISVITIGIWWRVKGSIPKNELFR